MPQNVDLMNLDDVLGEYKCRICDLFMIQVYFCTLCKNNCTNFHPLIINLQAKLLNCGHKFCTYCLHLIQPVSGRCPTCSTRITTALRVRQVDAEVAAIVTSLSDEAQYKFLAEKVKRKLVLKGEEEENASSRSSFLATERNESALAMDKICALLEMPNPIRNSATSFLPNVKDDGKNNKRQNFGGVKVMENLCPAKSARGLTTTGSRVNFVTPKSARGGGSIHLPEIGGGQKTPRAVRPRTSRGHPSESRGDLFVTPCSPVFIDDSTEQDLLRVYVCLSAQRDVADCDDEVGGGGGGDDVYQISEADQSDYVAMAEDMAGLVQLDQFVDHWSVQSRIPEEFESGSLSGMEMSLLGSDLCQGIKSLRERARQKLPNSLSTPRGKCKPLELEEWGLENLFRTGHDDKLQREDDKLVVLMEYDAALEGLRGRVDLGTEEEMDVGMMMRGDGLGSVSARSGGQRSARLWASEDRRREETRRKCKSARVREATTTTTMTTPFQTPLDLAFRQVKPLANFGGGNVANFGKKLADKCKSGRPSTSGGGGGVIRKT